jgi:RNA polymerase sigma-70 factor (ECF subfamily)
MFVPAALLPGSLLPAGLLHAGEHETERTCQRKVLLTKMDDAGNIAADVWHALSDELRAFLRSRVRRESDADDLLQDVFVRVVEKIGSLRQADRIDSWVYQIARNAIADFYRRHTPRPDGPVEAVVDPRGEVSNGNQNRAVGAWLSLMIGNLPKTLQDAVRMYEFEGLSQSEIADRLSISLSAAKSRVQRGRRQLEDLLRGSCQLELDRRGNVIGCTPATVDCSAQVSCECNGTQ